jgi:hypothetical protein
MMKKVALFLSLGLLMLAAVIRLATPAFASHAGTEFTGNLDCSAFGTWDYEFKVDSPASGQSWHNDGLLFVELNHYEADDLGWFIDWDSNIPVSAVLVKGSNGGYFYAYDPASLGDTDLHAIIAGASGKYAGVSHINFCYNEPEQEPQWCSPGYWRQPHHLDSWEATGYSPDDLFFDALGYYPMLSKKGTNDNAPTNPTLLEVLQNPQWYGGDAFNAVGDLLSEAHPDVDFDGMRVEDSCPLN